MGRSLGLILPVLVVFDLTAGYRTIKRSELRVYSPEYHHGLAPNKRVSEYWGKVPFHTCTDSYGLRVDCDRPTDSNVWFVGDSFVEGVGVPYPKTFVGLLNGRNLGVSSHSPKLEYYHLKWAFKRLPRPSQVYLFIDISDSMDELVYRAFPPGHNPGLHLWLYQHSWLGRKLLPHPGKDKSMPIEAKRSWKEFDRWDASNGYEGLYQAAASVRDINAFLRAHSVASTLVIYPWPQTAKKAAYRAFWTEFARKEKIRLIDLFDCLGNGDMRYYIPGDVHWNEVGHRAVAECLDRV